MPAVGIAREEAVMSPMHRLALAIDECADLKKNGTFQMWCRPNGSSRRSTKPYMITATRGFA